MNEQCLLATGLFPGVCQFVKFSIECWTTCPGVVLPTVGWALPHLLLIKTLLHRHTHRPIWIRQFLSWFLFLLLFKDRVSLCTPGCPWTLFVDQAYLELTEISFLSATSYVWTLGLQLETLFGGCVILTVAQLWEVGHFGWALIRIPASASRLRALFLNCPEMRSCLPHALEVMKGTCPMSTTSSPGIPWYCKPKQAFLVWRKKRFC